ncbi:hypothetical protein BDW59DRAFT_179867 [Aspergillus cavernicola]|uniref:Peptidase M20 dimerisation domain-containing protein n=1 Tax=Aspergillus cavernicola TaxID=176166 RepID=A0ABR4ICN3_9EURO
MAIARFLLLANGIARASALTLPPYSQIPMTIEYPSSDFQCDLPPILDPAGDGLPSADSLFSSEKALNTQVKRHQAIVQVPSVCWDDMGEIGEDKRWAPFYKLFGVLQKLYPTVHKRARLEKINTFGLLYTLQGTDSSLKPTLLTAHQDVVPVADASTWTHPPFEAHFDGEWLWARGASDDKNSLTAIFSALEGLLSSPSSNWTPRRTLLLAFGFDEECASNRGAGPIGERIQKRYGEDSVAIILDEGGFGAQSPDDKTLYLHPAVTEKTYLNLEFQLHARGGHSSVPLPHTGIGIISEIVVALEANPYKPEILKNSPVHKRLVCEARYSPDAQPKIGELLRKGDFDSLAAEFANTGRLERFLVQTSQAVDLIQGGQKINAMPEVITVTVNYRVAPHEKPVQVQHRAIEVISDVVEKYGLRVEAYKGDKEYHDYIAGLEIYRGDLKRHLNNEEVDYNGTLVVDAVKGTAAPVSPSSGAVWDIFSGTIQHTFAIDDGIVVPVADIMTGNTDTTHYLNLSRNVYRWTPAVGRGLENIHTVDERVNIYAHLKAVAFYYNFIRNFDAAEI